MTATQLSNRLGPEIDWFRKRFARQLNHISPHDGIKPIDMATAENWLIRKDLLGPIERAASGIEEKELSYASGLGGSQGVRNAACGFFDTFFDPVKPVEPDHIIIGPGASSLLDTLLYSICDEGDAILIEAPYWGSFEIYCALRNKVKLIPVFPPSTSDDINIHDYIRAFDTATQNAGCRVRGILFCNPQNPRGQIYSSSVLEALLQFCQEKELHFISDEVYALTTFGGTNSGHNSLAVGGPVVEKFTSVLHLDLDRLQVDHSRVHLLHSISKDLGSSGLRMGFIVTQANPALRFALAILNHNKVSNITSLVVERLLSDINGLRTTLSKNANRLRTSAWIAVEFLSRRNIAFYPPVAGVYIWARIGGANCTWEQEAELTKRFAQEGVFVGNGTDYTDSQAGWFRITFALETEELIEGLRRIARVLEDWQQPAEIVKPAPTAFGKGFQLSSALDLLPEQVLPEPNRDSAETELDFERRVVNVRTEQANPSAIADALPAAGHKSHEILRQLSTCTSGEVTC